MAYAQWLIPSKTQGSGNDTVNVTDNAGHTATCVITQAAGDPILEVAPASVQLDWNAATAQTSASFSVTSNTNWSIE